MLEEGSSIGGSGVGVVGVKENRDPTPDLRFIAPKDIIKITDQNGIKIMVFPGV